MLGKREFHGVGRGNGVLERRYALYNSTKTIQISYPGEEHQRSKWNTNLPCEMLEAL